MNLAALDNIAVNHLCWLQRCSLVGKALFAVTVLAAVLTTTSLVFVSVVAVGLLAMVLVNRLPLRPLFVLVLFPMIFASIFAFSLGDWYIGLVLVMRAGVAALTVLLMFVTTPPVRVLALLSAPMPVIFGELLYFTYRSLFLLWGTLDNMLTAVRLRGGFVGRGPKRWRLAAQIYGAVIIRAFDMAQRQYQILSLRGIGEGLHINRDWRLRGLDLSLLPILVLLIGGWFYV